MGDIILLKEELRGGTEEPREGCIVKKMEEEELVEGFRGGEGGDGKQLVSKF